MLFPTMKLWSDILLPRICEVQYMKVPWFLLGNPRFWAGFDKWVQEAAGGKNLVKTGGWMSGEVMYVQVYARLQFPITRSEVTGIPVQEQLWDHQQNVQGFQEPKLSWSCGTWRRELWSLEAPPLKIWWVSTVLLDSIRPVLLGPQQPHSEMVFQGIKKQTRHFEGSWIIFCSQAYCYVLINDTV